MDNARGNILISRCVYTYRCLHCFNANFTMSIFSVRRPSFCVKDLEIAAPFLPDVVISDGVRCVIPPGLRI